MGDFNSVLYQTERDNCEYSKRDSEVFLDFVSANALLKVPLIN